jgi:hypothetical protein
MMVNLCIEQSCSDFLDQHNTSVLKTKGLPCRIGLSRAVLPGILALVALTRACVFAVRENGM